MHRHDGKRPRRRIEQRPEKPAAPPPLPRPLTRKGGEPTYSVPVQNWLLRLRDAAGNTQPRTWHHDPAPVDGLPVEATELAETLAVIGTERPGEAARLAHSFDHEIFEARRAYSNTIREERGRIEQYNRDVASHNAEIDQMIADRHRHHSDSRGHLTSDLTEATKALLERELAAADLTAQAGVGFSPDDLSDTTVTGTTAVSDAEATVACGLPPPDTGVFAVPTLGWVGLSALVGAPLGIGLAVTAGLLYADQVTSEPVLSAAAVLCGTAIALCSKAAVGRIASLLGAFHFSGRSRESRAAAIILGGVLIGILTIDVSVLRAGLLAAHDASALLTASLSHRAAQPVQHGWSEMVVGLSLTTGFLLAAAAEGFSSGMAAAIRQAATTFSTGRQSAANAARRADPLVRRALAAVGKARVLRRRKTELTGELAALDAAHDADIEQFQASRRTLRDRPDAEGTLRLREAWENFVGPLLDFRHDLKVALTSAEPGTGKGWVVRIFRWCVVVRPRKRS
jgi:hypothetical protein